jgi:CHAP domain-containing protein
MGSFLDEARSQLGYSEQTGGWTKYGQWYADTVAHDEAFADANWCDMFVSWCADQCGLAEVVGQFAFTPWHAQWFADHGRWGRTPHPGDIVFYDWDGGKAISGIKHVGIVESVRSGAIVALEGNTANAMMRRVRSLGFVVGFGSPDYSSTPVSDDTAVVVSLGA